MEEENRVEDYSGDDPKSVETTYIGLAFAVLLAVTVIAVVFLTYRQQYLEAQRSVITPSFATLKEVREIQEVQLNGYTWVDPGNNRVTIPIEEGRARVLEEYGDPE
ncbi:MAG TPA: hypothetical protein EYN79_02540 [Planctomycetes bacterium]|nr:hypothetical protein [Planctomycetota bacterium]HIN80275.1 hypothetical protein [Planctomycetota bacterium]